MIVFSNFQLGFIVDTGCWLNTPVIGFPINRVEDAIFVSMSKVLVYWVLIVGGNLTE